MLRRSCRAVLCAVLLLVGTSCVRRDGRNSDCRWPGETPLHAPTPRHLSADAEFAEDLALRFADTHYGLHSPGFVSYAKYNSSRITCAQTLFAEVAKEHGVPYEQVSGSLGRNRQWVDLAEYLPFVMAYCLFTIFLARRVWRRFPPEEDGWIPGAVILLIVSLVVAVIATMLGETWGGLVETLRIGNGHMSYRAERLFWARHRLAEFTGVLVFFWVAAGVTGFRAHAHSRSVVVEDSGDGARKNRAGIGPT